MTFYIVVKINDHGQIITDDFSVIASSKEEAIKQYDLTGDGGEIIEVYRVINNPKILSV